MPIDPLSVAHTIERLQAAKPLLTPPLTGSVYFDSKRAIYRFAVGIPHAIRHVGVPYERIFEHPPRWYWGFAMECWIACLNDPKIQEVVLNTPGLPHFVPVAGISTDMIWNTHTS